MKAVKFHHFRTSTEISEHVSKSMRSNKGTNTKPEIALRKALWAAGLRGYRKNVAKLPGKPDIVFTKHKLVIFVHGCFWHGCPECSSKRKPVQTNSKYWSAKVEQNRERFDLQVKELEKLGWHVMVVWECHLKRGLSAIVETVSKALEV